MLLLPPHNSPHGTVDKQTRRVGGLLGWTTSQAYLRPPFPASPGGILVGMSQKNSRVGEKAPSKRGIPTLKHSTEHNITTNWEDGERICHQSPQAVCGLAGAQALLIEANSKMTQVMFQTFILAATQVASQARAVAIASGHTIVRTMPLPHPYPAIIPYPGLTIPNPRVSPPFLFTVLDPPSGNQVPRGD